MIDETLAREAFEIAINYLSVCARSEKEVKEKLYKKGYHRDIVDLTLEKLKGYRYIDDEQYVKTYLTFYGNKYGKKQLLFKLTTVKGVDKTLAQNVIEDLISEDDEIEKAVRSAEKYIAKKHLIARDKIKVANWLYSKGFAWDIINKVLRSVDFWVAESDENNTDGN